MNVYHLVESAAKQWPDKPAIHEQERSLNFMQLFQLCEACKNALLELGVTNGMAVGIMMRNSSSFIVALLASVGAKAIAMPLSHQLKKAELDDCIEQTGMQVILDDFSGLEPGFESPFFIKIGDEKIRFSYTGKNKSQKVAAHVPNAAFIRFTSGTTGKSKGVIVSHQSTIERIEAANKALLLGPGDTVVWVLPMAYHFLVSIILYLRFGAAIAICKDFLAASVIDFTNRFGGTLIYASPMHIRLLASDRSEKQMPITKKNNFYINSHKYRILRSFQTALSYRC